MRDDPAAGDLTVGRDYGLIAVNEVEVEREAHAEGVDAGAAWDQEALTCLLSIEVSQAEQAGAKSRRDANLAAEDDGRR